MACIHWIQVKVKQTMKKQSCTFKSAMYTYMGSKVGLPENSSFSSGQDRSVSGLDRDIGSVGQKESEF